MEVQKLTLSNPHFPEQLRHIPSPPKTIYYLGDISPILDRPRLAIVGSRKPTAYGRHITTQLAQEAAGYGIVIVSGLALGVDALAHRAALEVGGLTIAVLPGGLDRIHPRSNLRLAESILASGGVLLSEYPEGVSALKHHFIARNRLIAGISDAVLITEATKQSGTSHTVGFALDQGKSVLAVPGNITSTYSEGTNYLIKSGAGIATGVADLLHELNLEPTATTAKQIELKGSNNTETTLLRLLQAGLTTSADLIAKSKLDAATFNQTLTMLEITGRIRSLGGGNWALK